MVSLRLTAALLLTVVATTGLPSVFGASEAGTSAPVGFVSRVQNEASVLSGGKAILAIAGTPVAMKNELRTGAEARLEVTFNDGTVLTLGERANMIVDSFVYDPGNGSGEAILRATEGAFRFLTGKIKELEGRRIAVVTPVAEIGVRGTEFWGARSTPYMGCSCFREKSPFPLRPEAWCCRNRERERTSPRRWGRRPPPRSGTAPQSRARWRRSPSAKRMLDVPL